MCIACIKHINQGVKLVHNQYYTVSRTRFQFTFSVCMCCSSSQKCKCEWLWVRFWKQFLCASKRTIVNTTKFSLQLNRSIVVVMHAFNAQPIHNHPFTQIIDERINNKWANASLWKRCASVCCAGINQVIDQIEFLIT